MSQLDKPNLVVPLAYSTTERWQAAGRDQLTTNAAYQVVANPLTGKTTPYLCSRPGIVASGTFQNTGATAAHISGIPNNAGNTNSWLYTVDADVIEVSNASTTTVIVTDTGNNPTIVYGGQTSISGTEYVVIQTEPVTPGMRAFYSSTIGTWTEITDADFTALNHVGMMAFLDGYAFVGTFTNRLYNSDTNSLANWTATSFLSRSTVLDPGAGLMRHGSLILFGGTEVIECFYNAGNASGSVLSRLPQLTARIGLRAGANGSQSRNYFCELNGVTYFTGYLPGNASGVFAFNGSRFEKVSTSYIDKKLDGLSGGLHVSAHAVMGEPAVHFYHGTSDWYVFFPRLNQWSNWTSDFVHGISHRGFFLTRDAYITTSGAISTSARQDGDSATPTWTSQFRLPKTGPHRKRMYFFGLLGDTNSTGTVGVQFSDDDGQNFSTSRDIDMTANKKTIYRCGSYSERVVKLTHSSNANLRLEAAVGRID